MSANPHSVTRVHVWVRAALGLVVLASAIGVWAVLEARTRVRHLGSVTALVEGRHLVAPDASSVGHFGMVALIGGRCLGLRSGDGQEFLLVWPQGSHLIRHGSRYGIQVRDRDLVVGEQIDYGVISTQPSADFAVPATCQRHVAQHIYDPGAGPSS